MPEVSQNDEETDSDIGRRNCGDQQRMDNAAANQSTKGTSEDDEYVELQTRKWTRKAKLWRATIGTCACLLASWLMGYLGFSSVWVVLVAIGAYQVWDGHVVDLLQDNLRYEALRFRKKRVHRTEETAEWLNTIINRWWVFVSESIFAQIKSNLDPLLNECKPAILQSVELRQLSLGNQTPFVTRVKVFDVPPSTEPGVASKNDHRHLVIEANVKLHCDDFHMVLTGRMGHKGVGVDMDLVVEKLHISGTMQLSVQLNREAQFPHVTKVSVTFVKKPKVWFGLRVLKALSMMEVPGLKTWVHSLVMDALTSALVDPGKVVINMSSRDETVPGQSSDNVLAQGVLTMTMSWDDTAECRGQPSGGGKADSKKWCVLRLGEEEHVITPDISSRDWQDCHSFLVDFPQDETLVVKVKTKRIISTMTLATYEVPLNQVLQQKTLETVLRRKDVKGNTMPSILLKLQYAPLPPVILEPASVVRSQPDGAVDSEPCSRAGVLYVCVHSADGLSTADGRERPNPFCLVYSNGKKVKTTHFASHTCNPKWDSPVEFLVMDYSKTVISFAVWSWDSSKMADSSFLGLASLTLSIGEMSIVKRAVPLSVTPSPLLNGLNSGVITVSVLFREAPSVAQSEMTVCKEPRVDIPVQMNHHVVESSLASTAMFLSSVQDQQLWCGNARESFSASGQTDMTVELFLVRAKDLVSKDLNGYSDPYCEVKLNDECKYKSRVQRKTLNPYWDESVIVQMRNSGENLTVIVWDHDTFGMRDFLGSMSVSASDVRRVAAKDCGEWLALQNTTSGELELKFRIISDEKEITATAAPESPESPTEALANTTAEDEGGPLAPPAQPADDLNADREPTFQTFRPTTNTVPKAPAEAARDREGEGSGSPKLPTTVRRPSASGPRPPPPPLPPVAPTPGKKSPSPSKASSSTVSSPSSDSTKGPQVQTPTTPTSGGTPTSGTHAYSSLRKMKNKVKKAFGQPLRRFRSEASVHEEKAKGLRERIRIERRKDDAYASCTDIDSIPQDALEGTASRVETEDAVSPKPDGAFSFSVAPEVETRTRYYNVFGRVIQATGLDVKGANTLYCRIKLVSENCDQNSPKHKNGNAGRTIAKSKLLPANKNVPFNVDFKMENSSGISSLAKLSFDIRTASKEPFASKQITIQDLLEDVGTAKPGEQVRTCLCLDSGATLELVVSFGKCTSEPVSQGQPNSVSKLLRSWSVHKIGKI